MVKKWPYHLLVGMFVDKVKNVCDYSMILWERGANLLTAGILWSPPLLASFRLILKEHQFQIKLNSILMISSSSFDLSKWFVFYFNALRITMSISMIVLLTYLHTEFIRFMKNKNECEIHSKVIVSQDYLDYWVRV